MTELQLELAAGEQMVEAVEVLDAVVVGERGDDVTPIAAVVLEPSALAQRNLFGEAERIAARAASAGTRRQYAAIYRAFGDWLREQLGRPPVVGDIDADVISVRPPSHDERGEGRTTGGAGDRARVCVYGPRARPPARPRRRDQGCARSAS